MKKLILPLFALCMSATIFAQDQVPSATNATSGVLTVKFAVASPGTNAHCSVFVTNSTGTVLINTLAYRFGANYASQSTTYWPLLGNTWTAASPKLVTAADAYTGATYTAAIPATTVYWGRSAAMAASVAALPDGNYKVYFEENRKNNTITITSATFAKGPATSAPVVANKLPWSGMTVSWVPAVNAVNNPTLAKMYNIYPSPAVSSLYVSGPDVKLIEVCNLEGKSIFTTINQKLDVSALPKGAYLAVITANEGTVVKKFLKK